MNKTMDGDHGVDEPTKHSIHLTIHPRFYHVPAVAMVVGSAIGIMRGGRSAALRFLAENAHRPPRTVQGWYFYNKTKNYKVILGALKGAGADGGRLALISLGWVGIEQGLNHVGWGEVKELGAGAGTAGVFSAIYRLPWKTTRRTLILGLIMGGALKGLSLARSQLSEEDRRADGEAEIKGQTP